jgi:hypothetical protein
MVVGLCLATREYVAANHDQQPGDPRKAAKAIAAALDVDTAIED